MFNLYSEETKQVVNQLKKLMAGNKRRQKKIVTNINARLNEMVRRNMLTVIFFLIDQGQALTIVLRMLCML